uniref:Monooxygenase DBH like 1 n=1 Tax=Equus asinus TaxID=9793 RepID=A0A9L0IFL1_EQUAS
MRAGPLLLLGALLGGAAAGGSGRPLPHRTLLDPDGGYWLSWGPRGGRLAFRLEVRTAGYVGFGFSPTGAMAAADIVVGGVAHGRPYLQGRGSQNFPNHSDFGAPRHGADVSYLTPEINERSPRIKNRLGTLLFREPLRKPHLKTCKTESPGKVPYEGAKLSPYFSSQQS